MRQAVIGSQVMVVSPHYLASAAGARILEQGATRTMRQLQSVQRWLSCIRI